MTTTHVTTPTVANTPVDERVTVTFAARGESSTKWLEFTFPVDAEPTALFEALREIGFVGDDGMAAVPPYPASTWDRSKPIGQQHVPLGYMEQEAHFSKSGTDLFAGWTVAEERANMRAARAVLRRFGFNRVPVWKKTWQDMI